MKLPNVKRKVVVGALAAGLVMGVGGVAAAYFLSNTASATGSGKIGKPATSSISMTEATTGPTLVPGGTPQTYTFTVTNKSKTKGFTLTATYTFATATTAGAKVIVTDTTTKPVPGCKATWFKVTYKTGAAPTPNPYPFKVTAAGTYTLIYQLYFLTTATTNQVACATAVPSVKVTVK